MRKTAACALFASASFSAAGVTYSPLMSPGLAVDPDINGISAVPNLFGGNVSATILSGGQAYYGEPFSSVYISGYAFSSVYGAEVTLIFSEPVTRIILGLQQAGDSWIWDSTVNPPQLVGYNPFDVSFFQGATPGTFWFDWTQIASTSVPSAVGLDATNDIVGQLDYTNLSGFNAVTIHANSIALTVGALNVIPEPSTYGLALGGLALVGAVIRRRKASR